MGTDRADGVTLIGVAEALLAVTGSETSELTTTPT